MQGKDFHFEDEHFTLRDQTFSNIRFELLPHFLNSTTKARRQETKSDYSQRNGDLLENNCKF